MSKPMTNPKVELHIAAHGVITLELEQEKAPKSVANFLSYVSKGHYDNTVFGKVVSGMEVVNNIKSVPTGAGGPFPSDVPKTPVLIISASLNK